MKMTTRTKYRVLEPGVSINLCIPPILLNKLYARRLRKKPCKVPATAPAPAATTA
jgi:hypothetical protein